MFAEHQPIIGAWARECPENLRQVAMFSVLSAHSRFYTLNRQMDDVHKQGEHSVHLYAWKRDAFNWWHQNVEGVFIRLLHAWECEEKADFADIALFEALQAPGFGLIKAGFFVQMCFGVSGCIDTHNQKMYDIPLKVVKASNPSKYSKAMLYNRLIYDLGGSATIWDNWCTRISTIYPDKFADPHDVSKFHCVALGLME